MAEGERRIIALADGQRDPQPVPAGAAPAAAGRACAPRLADPATWKDLTFLLLQFPFGLVSFIVTGVVLGVGLQALTLPLWYWAIPDGVNVGFFRVDQLWEALALVPLGAVVLLLGIPALSALGRLYVELRRGAARARTPTRR